MAGRDCHIQGYGLRGRPADAAQGYHDRVGCLPLNDAVVFCVLGIRDVMTVMEGSTVADAVEIFKARPVGRLPVVNNKKELARKSTHLSMVSEPLCSPAGGTDHTLLLT